MTSSRGEIGFRTVLALVLLAVSCGKPTGVAESGGRVPIAFSVAPPAITRSGAVLPSGESDISSLDLLAFRTHTGAPDAYVRVEGEGISTLRASLTAGETLRWYLIANAPKGALSAFTDEDGFLAGRTLLSDSSPSALVMHASGTQAFARNGDGTPVTVRGIELRRYAAKVTLGEIDVAWLDAFDRTPPCTLDRLVLVNARGDCPLSGIPSALPSDLWFNRSEDDCPTGFTGDLLGWDGPLPIPSSAPVTVGRSLYAMPNPSDVTDTADTLPWAPRQTRLCLRLTIDGITQWYAVGLPPMEGNCHYIVSRLVIMGPGTATPDRGTDRDAVSLTVHVEPWTDNPIKEDFDTQ